MQDSILGWDVGGAHLKVALLAGDTIIHVMQQPCPLWKGIAELEKSIAALLATLPYLPQRHAVTMTGELVDCFKSRQEGVDAIIGCLQQLLPNQDLMIFAGHRGFLSPADIVADDYIRIASANWLASASLAGDHVSNGLFVDIGSTTTDIVRLRNNELQLQGYTDYQRLVSDELVYTGVVRTPVIAICQRALFKQQMMGLMAEFFATSADVYRLTNELHPDYDQADTADGADKSLESSALRLSRLTGCEFASADLALWIEFASYIRKQQIQLIETACQRQLNGLNHEVPCTLVAAGVGRFLLKEIARNLNMHYLDFADLLKSASNSVLNVSDCAPAAAVALRAAGLHIRL